jgi:hypothetical protein
VTVPDELARLKGYDDLVSRIYGDTDFSPGGRETALAIAWVLYHPADSDTETNPWRRATALLGPGTGFARTHRIVEAAAEDLPWYDSRLQHWNQMSGECEGPRVRPYQPRRAPQPATARVTLTHLNRAARPHPGSEQAANVASPVEHDRVCGAHATICVTEYDHVTGWETPHWFCSRHKQRAREVEAQLRAAVPSPPPPIPNRGGVLPRYFAGDWVKMYAWVAEKAQLPSVSVYGWKPPYYGVCRDDWPVPGKTPIPRRPRLSLVAP